VPALVRELEDWLVDIRLKASQLLYSLILNAETHVTHHLEKILDGMYRASGDEDTSVVINVSFYYSLHSSTSLENSKWCSVQSELLLSCHHHTDWNVLSYSMLAS
jgi:hypothetical protein